LAIFTSPRSLDATSSAVHTRTSLVKQALNRPLADYYLLLVSAALLIGIGIMMVLSSSSVYAYAITGDAYYFVKRQVVFMLAGVLGAWLLARRSPKALRVLGWIGLGLAVAMLLATFVPGLGYDAGKGNRNWLQLGTPWLRLQPSEFAKLAMAVWAADVLARKEKLLDQPRHLLIPFLPVAGVLMLLVVFQHDLGTAMVMAAIIVSILWVVGAPMKILAAMGGLAAVGVLLLVVSSPNRMARIAMFLHADASTDTTEQPVRALYALASGGWWGRGLGASRQKWGSLAEAHTDYIYAVIGEELGLVGALLVLALFLILGFAGFRVALRAKDLFTRLAAAGITSWFIIQALVNIAVVLHLIPVMGVPLPFLSYGGSALMANMLALGVLISCARNEPRARQQLAARSAEPKPRMTTVVGRRRG